jgi:thiol:disulfide interchange protein DsbD
MFRLLASLFAAVALSPLADAQFTLPGKSGGTEAALVAETTAIAPGKPFTVALQLAHPAGWHSYYKNSGGIEIPPAITWTLPEGFTAGPIQWPVPEIKVTEFGKSLIYTGTPVFLVEITPSEKIAAGQTVTLTAKTTWQICDKSCKDESKELTLTLPTAAEAALSPDQAPLFAKARQNLPATNADWTATAHREAGGVNLVLTPKSPAARAIQSLDLGFIPDQPFLDAVTEPAAIRHTGDTWTVSLKTKAEDFIGQPIAQGSSFSGILVPKTPGLATVALAEIPITAGPAAPIPANAPKPSKSYLLIFGGMFLGGLILNLMPCVFPVIGIKIMGFVQQAGHERKKIVLHGLVFTLGVLLSFWVLATALFLGGITNWGNQLQDPRVNFVTILIMLLLGMNLYGVFEIGTAATGVGGNLVRKQGIAGTFFSGILATLVATPCSGPFLGVAIGAAAVLPAVPFFAAFTCMAIGLALPYLVLSAFPKLVDRLPRPGAWMESFKQGMSFLLFATTGYFLWVYSAQVFDRNEGQKGLWVMLGVSAVACAAWIYGRWNQPFKSTATRLTAKVIALAFVATGVALAWPWPAPVQVAGEEKLHVEWQPWSQAEVDRLLAAGKPVYIDFTAKWCLTCQVNKSRAYPPEVVKLMRQKGIVALRADKTNPDPAIEAKLKELGRTAIPVNVLLVPGKKESFITAELLSAGDLTELFTKEIP